MTTLLLLIIGGSGCKYNQQPTPTALSPQPMVTATSPTPKAAEENKVDTTGWKEYKNQYLGFKMEYPPEIITGPGSRIDMVNFWVKNDYELFKSGVGVFPIISVTFAMTSPHEITQSWVNTIGSYTLQDQKKLLGGKEIFLAQGGRGLLGTKLLIIPIAKEPLLVHALDTPLANQILSTFEFIKPSPEAAKENKVNTIGWKTYRNERLEFSLLYPKDFTIDETASSSVTFRSPLIEGWGPSAYLSNYAYISVVAEDANGQSLDNFVRNYVKSVNTQTFFEETSKKIVLSGLKAIEMSTQNMSSGRETFIVHKNVAFIISEESMISEEFSITELIRNSFKIIK